MYVNLMEFCIILCLDSLFAIFFPFLLPSLNNFFFSIFMFTDAFFYLLVDVLRNRLSQLLFSLFILQLQIFFNPV